MDVKGNWYDGVTSRLTPATMSVTEDGVVVVDVEGRARLEQPFAELTISPRLGNTPRYIYLAGGAKFETLDNLVVDQWVKQWRGSSWDALVHRWESHWHTVAVALVLVVAFVWGLVSQGVPVASYYIAHALPEVVSTTAGEQTLSTLDELVFFETLLSVSERARITKHFQPVIQAYAQLPIEVQFRNGGAIGPNAFALPNGTLVFTDQMVALSRSDDELLAVLAHEIGHVAERHSMQTLVRNSLLGFILLAVSGDVSASSEVLLGLPVLLMELSYSRDFEREADDFALAYLKQNSIDPQAFVALMSRLESARECMQSAGLKKGDQKDGKKSDPETLDQNDGQSEGLLNDELSDEQAVASDEAPEVEQEQQLTSDERSSRRSKKKMLLELSCLKVLPDNVASEISGSAEDDGEQGNDQWQGYLSSHPATDERLEKFR